MSQFHTLASNEERDEEEAEYELEQIEDELGSANVGVRGLGVVDADDVVDSDRIFGAFILRCRPFERA